MGREACTKSCPALQASTDDWELVYPRFFLMGKSPWHLSDWKVHAFDPSSPYTFIMPQGPRTFSTENPAQRHQLTLGFCRISSGRDSDDCVQQKHRGGRLLGGRAWPSAHLGTRGTSAAPLIIASALNAVHTLCKGFLKS